MDNNGIYSWAINKTLEANKNDLSRQKEISEKRMYFGDVCMKYDFSVIGEPDCDGYPLYIALHGGGGSDTPDVNDQQWEHMQIYYRDSIKNGIYLAPRGVRDTCDCHSNPESFPLYERLIGNFITFYNVDPNRIYMLGYSAGGDGTVLVTPVMADRFAAGNMSAGYTAERNYTNLYNMPLRLQGGELDYFYGRNVLLAKCHGIFEELRNRFSGGYEVEFFMHFGKAHAFMDHDPKRTEFNIIKDLEKWLNDSDRSIITANTNAVDFLDRYKRNPLPERVIWDLSYRQPLMKSNSFYWLSADKNQTKGIIDARLDRERNAVIINGLEKGVKLSILLNDKMLDLQSDIAIVTPDGYFSHKPVISEITAEKTAAERDDRNYIFTTEIEITGR